MAKQKTMSAENYNSLLELVTVFHKALLHVHPARNTREITDIQTRTMMLIKARKFCKKIPNFDIGQFVDLVSENVVSRAPQMHKKFIEETPLYKDKYEIFSKQVDDLVKEEKIRFS